MFGSHDDATPAATDDTTTTPPTEGVALPPVTTDAATSTDLGAPAPGYDSNGFLTTDPAAVATPAPADDATPATGAPAITTPVVAPAVAPADADELLSIKQQALQQLSPLVGHLDQTPEEKFRTTMMMIQAADNQALVKDAYAAAQEITDEKTKAQALLDIVNEINYFTQHQEPPA